MATTISDFVKKYDIILFDMDGVITSEQRYWDSSALSLYQMFTDKPDVKYAMENVAKIRGEIFCNDETISLLKDMGVNSNWDLTYAIYSAAKILNTKTDFKAMYDYFKSLDCDALKLYVILSDNAYKRLGDEYMMLVQLFQEWYLGDELSVSLSGTKSSIPGKPGLLENEIPILSVEETQKILKTLYDNDKILGTGTGRVDYEIERPLDNWDIRQYFDKNRLITYTYIQNAEEKYKGAVLTKPHPYIFLKGMLGKDYDDGLIINDTYDKSLISKTLVVGDAGADLLSAKAAGMDFAAVLTGVSGEKTKSFFEENNADYILNDISGLIKDV